MQTLALPVYNSVDICWLAMESLCRQETKEKWELIICEEKQENKLGEFFFFNYFDRLKKAGCVDIQYIEPANWIPLSRKWKMIADKARGENFFLIAADDYNAPDRIERTIKALKKHDWYAIKNQYFYSIEKEQVIKLNAIGDFPGNKIAFKTELAKSLPYDSVKSGVDMWIRKSLGEINEYLDTSNSYKKEVCTDGLNNIQKVRLNYYDNPNSLWEKTNIKIDNILPADIVVRLQELKKKLTMRLKKDAVGSQHYIKSLNMNITIENDPDKLTFYKSLGLNVFENATSNKRTGKRTNRNRNRKRNTK